jgi:hypothetical protein
VEIRIKPFLKGLLSFAIPSLRTTHKIEAGSTASSEFCYSIFLRHFSYISQFTDGKVPRVVAELGPGSSIGMGLAALIAGAETYYGLDIASHLDIDRNLAIFDDLVEMFRRWKQVPQHGMHESTFPLPLNWEFPATIEKNIDHSLNADRIQALRDDLLNRTGNFIKIAVPWDTTDVVPAQSVDWLMTHSVMEHIDNLEEAYKCCSHWVRRGGIMTHEIDYSSHRLTRHWNGHWTMGDVTWTLVRGQRPYLINRIPHSGHEKLIKRNNFSILKDVHHIPGGGIQRQDFAAAFRQMSDSDSKIQKSFVVCQAS